MNAEPKISQTIAAKVPLLRLRPGHDHPAADINMRKTYDEAETLILAASILKEGVIQSLLVCPPPDDPLTDDSPLYVAAGGRRLAALRLLYEQDAIPADYPVPVTIDLAMTPAEALGKSMIENDVRVPPHPADRYEAFRALIDLGMTEAGVADRFGTTEIRVRRALALGALSPAIRDAWRQGVINENAAKSFTLALDHKTQDKLYAKLKKKNALSAWQIRRELRPDNSDIPALLAFVGADQYRAAGGEVHEDLFGTDHAVSDPVLLKGMANDILDRECERLKGMGWSWAAPAASLPQDWQQWKHTEPLIEWTAEETGLREALERELGALNDKDPYDDDKDGAARKDELERDLTIMHNAVRERGFNDAQRGKAGCALSISDEGALIVTHGLIRPGAAKAKKKTQGSEDAPEHTRAAAAADGVSDGGERNTPPSDTPAPAKRKKAEPAEEPAAPPAPSSSAMKWLSQILTFAAEDALRADPDLALALIVCAAARRPAHKPLRLSVSGLSSFELANLMDSHSIEDNLAVLASRTTGQIKELIARIAGAMLDMTTENAAHPPLKDAGIAAICAALGPNLIQELRARFDLKTWFQSVPKALALAAIEEALGEDHLARAKKLKAKEIAAYAAEHIQGTGWLPEYLRTPHYSMAGHPSPLEGEGGAPSRESARQARGGAPGEGKSSKSATHPNGKRMKGKKKGTR